PCDVPRARTANARVTWLPRRRRGRGRRVRRGGDVAAAPERRPPRRRPAGRRRVRDRRDARCRRRPPAVVLISSRDALSYRRRIAGSPARGFLAKSELTGPAFAALVA